MSILNEVKGIFVAHESNPQGNFTIIPNEITRSRELNPYAKTIIIFLLSNKPGLEFKVYKKTLPTLTNLTKGQVKRGFDQLVKMGYIIENKIRIKGVIRGIQYVVFSSPRKNPLN